MTPVSATVSFLATAFRLGWVLASSLRGRSGARHRDRERAEGHLLRCPALAQAQPLVFGGMHERPIISLLPNLGNACAATECLIEEKKPWGKRRVAPRAVQALSCAHAEEGMKAQAEMVACSGNGDMTVEFTHRQWCLFRRTDAMVLIT